VPERDLEVGEYRLLEVDNRAVVPYQIETTVIATSADVLHAWALPAMGVKIDAVPGRLNRFSIFVDKPGVYYGQCSEICGANHSFIPIVVEAVDLKDFIGLEF
jgi:cytochrome c oxidase subunit 2